MTSSYRSLADPNTSLSPFHDKSIVYTVHTTDTSAVDTIIRRQDVFAQSKLMGLVSSINPTCFLPRYMADRNTGLPEDNSPKSSADNAVWVCVTHAAACRESPIRHAFRQWDRLSLRPSILAFIIFSQPRFLVCGKGKTQIFDWPGFTVHWDSKTSQAFWAFWLPLVNQLCRFWRLFALFIICARHGAYSCMVHRTPRGLQLAVGNILWLSL